MTDLPPNARLVAYLRDSGGVEQDLSLEQQEAAIRAWAAGHGHSITHIFRDEALSGSTIVGRQAFEAMLAHFRSAHCTDLGLVLWKYNRFARDFDDAQFYKADLRRRGYIVHSLNDQVPDGADGRLFEAAIDWMNARYLQDLRVDVRRGLHHFVRTTGCVPGEAPVGFRKKEIVIGARRDGAPHIGHRWEIDPETAPKVQEAFRLKAAGLTHRQIVDQTGLLSNPTSLNVTFRNRIYLGELHYGKGDTQVVDLHYVPALIDAATWNAVQQINQRNANHFTHQFHPRRSVSRFLLSGLLFCGVCGDTMNGHLIKQRMGSRNSYYLCSSRKTAAGSCGSPMIAQAALEEAVLENLFHYILIPGNFTELTKAIRQAEAKNKARDQLANLQKEITKLDRQMANISAAIADAGHTRPLLDQLNRLERAKQEAEIRAAELTAALQHQRSLNPVEIEHYLDKLKGALKKDAYQARIILRGFIKSITIWRQGRRGHGEIAYFVPRDLMPISVGSSGTIFHRHNFEFAIPTKNPAVK